MEGSLPNSVWDCLVNCNNFWATDQGLWFCWVKIFHFLIGKCGRHYGSAAVLHQLWWLMQLLKTLAATVDKLKSDLRAPMTTSSSTSSSSSSSVVTIAATMPAAKSYRPSRDALRNKVFVRFFLMNLQQGTSYRKMLNSQHGTIDSQCFVTVDSVLGMTSSLQKALMQNSLENRGQCTCPYNCWAQK